MIELIIKEYFDTNFKYPLLLEFPDEDLDFFVLLDKISSDKQNSLNACTVALQSYAPSLYEAAELNYAVIETVEKMIELDEIAGIKLNTDHNFMDLERKRYRYQAVFNITHY